VAALPESSDPAGHIRFGKPRELNLLLNRSFPRWFYGVLLQVIDVEDPENPRRIGSYSTGGEGRGLVVNGNLAYVVRGRWSEPGAWRTEIDVFDVGDPAMPRLISRQDAVVVSNHIAYGAGSWLDEVTTSLRNGLFAIDIGDPSNPRLIGAYETETAPCRVAVFGHLAVVTTPGYLRIVDIGEPAVPRPLGQIAIQGEVRHVTISDRFAYVALEHDGLEVIDLTNPAIPRRVGGSKSLAAFSTCVRWDSRGICMPAAMRITIPAAFRPPKERAIGCTCHPTSIASTASWFAPAPRVQRVIRGWRMSAGASARPGAVGVGRMNASALAWQRSFAAPPMILQEAIRSLQASTTGSSC
jgi:hypothetical protein